MEEYFCTNLCYGLRTLLHQIFMVSFKNSVFKGIKGQRPFISPAGLPAVLKTVLELPLCYTFKELLIS